MQSVAQWAELNFGGCQLGDKRRTNRLVQVAEQIASNPSASIPSQSERWRDLKAAYRLFDCEEATFEAIACCHWQQTKQRARGRCLVIDDTTEISFRKLRQIEGTGPTGNGSGHGFLLHNALLVHSESEEILGVAGQTIHYRKQKRKKKENASQRMKRERESQVWGTVIDQIGPPSEDAQYVHVCDRAADNFEVYCHLLHNQCDWVIRASRLNRQVQVDSDEKMPLKDYLSQMELIGTYTLCLRSRDKHPSREAHLEVRLGQARIPMPKHVSPWVRSLKQPPIVMNVVEVVEVDAPRGVKPIRWILLTSLPVHTFEDAWTVIGYYEKRWLIEEYHKSIKSGCRIESRQLKAAGRLEALLGITSVVAVRLLQLKSLARSEPDLPAQRVVPRVWLKMLKLARKEVNRVHDLTAGQFYREVAKLGGFIGRKSDGEPGWITIWRGWEKLNTYVFVATKLNLQL